MATVNATLQSLVGGTRSWINSALEGTDLPIARFYAVLWHFSFLFITMITCVFLGTELITKFIVAVSLLLNLALTLHESDHALDPVTVTSTSLGACIIVQLVLSSVLAVWHTRIIQRTVLDIKEKLTPKKYNMENSNTVTNLTAGENDETITIKSELNDDYNYLDSPISSLPLNLKPRSRKSRSRAWPLLSDSTNNSCNAKTQLGTPCKIRALSGRDFCHRHKAGDPIYPG